MRYTPESVLSTYAAVGALNANFADISALFERCVFRDGTTPNSMQADLDLNHFSIKNLAAPSDPNDPVRLSDLQAAMPSLGGSSLATLATSAGGGMIGTAATGTGAVTRTIQSKLRDVVSVKDFGAVGDGVTDDLTAFNNAIASGKAVFVPEGSYALSAKPTTPTGNFRMFGAGKSKTFLLINHAAASGALAVSPAAVTNYVEITDLTLKANYASGPCQFGVIITFPSAASTPYSQLTLDVDFQSDYNAASPYPNTWGRGIRLTNVWYPKIRVRGSSAPNIGDTGNTGFLEITGGTYGCIAADIDVVWYYGADGIRCSAYSESIKMSHASEFVGVTRGVYVPATTPVGGVAGTYRSAYIWLDGHIAAHTACVDLDNVYDLVSYCNIGRWNNPVANNWTGYKLNNVNCPQIFNVISGAEASAGIATKGIVATGSGSAHGRVDVRFENTDTYFTLDANTSHWSIRAMTNDVGGNNFSIAGTKHDVQWMDANGNILRSGGSLTLAGAAYSAVGELGKTSASGVTYTASEFLSDAIFRSGGAALSDTTPSAAQLVAAMPGSIPGTGKRITINNQNTGTLTLVAGAGVTLVSTTTVGSNQSRDFLIRVTNSTLGAEAVRVIGLQTGAI